MSIQSDIVTALAGVASGRVYPQAAPADAALPFVIYRRVGLSPITTLQGFEGSINSVFTFDCYANTYAAALALADAVRAGIEGSQVLTEYRDAGSGEDYEPVTDAFMEPVTFGFWHA